MIRSIIAVLSGSVIWGVLWVAINGILQSAIPDIARADGRIDSVPVLGLFLFISIDLSVLAGYLTAWIIGRKEIGHTVALGILQLVIGIMVQMQYLELLPMWYHTLFLLFLIPGNIAGGYFRVRYRHRSRQAIIQTT